MFNQDDGDDRDRRLGCVILWGYVAFLAFLVLLIARCVGF